MFYETAAPVNLRKPMEKFFQSVWGQEPAVNALSRNFSRNRVASAYLFSGPEGTGKMSTALIFAKMLLCEKPGSHDCACRSCRMFAAGAHPDFMGVVPSEPKSKVSEDRLRDVIRNPAMMGKTPKGRSIKIEQIRGLISALSLKSSNGGRKVALIESAETMNRNAENALLKTLEEPAPDTVALLITSKPTGLLPTTVSRCRTVRFVPLQPQKLAVLLEKHADLPSGEALRIAILAEGRPGAALGAGMEHAREVDDEAVHILSRIAELEPEDIIQWAEKWRQRRGDLKLLLERMMEIIRSGIDATPASSSDTMKSIFKDLDGLPAGRLVDGYFALLDVIPMLEFNPNVQLFLESTVFNLQSILLKGESFVD